MKYDQTWFFQPKGSHVSHRELLKTNEKQVDIHQQNDMTSRPCKKEHCKKQNFIKIKKRMQNMWAIYCTELYSFQVDLAFLK